MNPSASGWVKKLIAVISKDELLFRQTSEVFYNALKKSGFIYGTNICVVNNIIEKKDHSTEELAKINFLLSFYYFYKQSQDSKSFTDSLIDYFNTIERYKTTFLQQILGEKKSITTLEKIIDKRIKISDNYISKSFNYFMTNTLLFIDVLGYKSFLTNNTISKNDLKRIETEIETLVILVINCKKQKTKYDENLVKLLESSLRYNDKAQRNYKDVVALIHNHLEKLYVLDMVSMASWSDKKIDENEIRFLNTLAKNLKLNKILVNNALTDIEQFNTIHQNDIYILNSKNSIQDFYINATKLVGKLLKRNKKRLLTELNESKQLLVLLSQSTTRQLNDNEQKEVQKQLLDIFKTIPSLAIFLLPGGMLLLPLVIKFIPKLLPSAFDENRIED